MVSAIYRCCKEFTIFYIFSAHRQNRNWHKWILDHSRSSTTRVTSSFISSIAAEHGLASLSVKCFLETPWWQLPLLLWSSPFTILPQAIQTTHICQMPLPLHESFLFTTVHINTSLFSALVIILQTKKNYIWCLTSNSFKQLWLFLLKVSWQDFVKLFYSCPQKLKARFF